jgi:hypothetical protein
VGQGGASRRGEGGGRAAGRTDRTKRARGVRSNMIKESAVCRKYLTGFFAILPPCQLIPDGGSSCFDQKGRFWVLTSMLLLFDINCSTDLLPF